jgi:2-oxoglutarate dehydrogenase E2 component (dihydrolipoamide succinyltransferase)
MAVELKIPPMGESITEVEIGEWRKAKGDAVAKDETVVFIESDKATVELPAPVAGTITEILKRKGQTATIGEVIGYLDGSGKSSGQPPPVPQPTKEPVSTKEPPPVPPATKEPVSAKEPPRVMPAAERVLSEQGLRAEEVKATGPGGRLLKEDVLRHVEKRTAEPATNAVVGSTGDSPVPSGDSPDGSEKASAIHSGSRSTQATSTIPVGGSPTGAGESPAPPILETAKAGVEKRAFPEPAGARAGGAREEDVVPMSRLRRTVAERLVEAQHTAALLTTFNEIDMSAVMGLRKEYAEAFLAKYGVKLGFMSFFVKAAVDALKLVPQVNAEIRGTDLVYRNYFDIGVAIGGGKGLVVPVLRSAERMSFAQVETAINDFAKRAKENKLKLEEIQGGTFTISNGGVYGSLLSTPIINPPQSGILGLHAIQDRPVAREGNVVIRPMMYAALTYDHRNVDGREAVTFLKRIKELIENPARMLMEV